MQATREGVTRNVEDIQAIGASLGQVADASHGILGLAEGNAHALAEQSQATHELAGTVAEPVAVRAQAQGGGVGGLAQGRAVALDLHHDARRDLRR